MKIIHCVFVAVAALSVAACQREADAPTTMPTEPASTVQPAPEVVPETAPVPAPAETDAAAPVVEQAAMDYSYRCRLSNGAWNETLQACDVTPALCPTFGTWVNEAGCKAEVAQAECVADGQQFVEGHGCMVRFIPAAAMRDADFSKE